MAGEFKWSSAEKKAARKAFDAAFARECGAIRAKVAKMLQDQSDIRQIWRIHDYLTEERRKVDLKYDYRYSQLIHVFSVLMLEGWLAETDLRGLSEDKIAKIKDLVELYSTQ